jgi:glyoxylase I family protein
MAAMALLGLHHVTVGVRDIAEARAFYVGALGCTEIERPDFGFDGMWIDCGGTQLHFFVTEAPRPEREHFALAVRGIDGVVAGLEAQGVGVFVADPVPGAGRQAFLRDPSGNLIELNEPEEQA